MKKILSLVIIISFTFGVLGCKSAYKKKTNQMDRRLNDHPGKDRDAIKRMNKRK